MRAFVVGDQRKKDYGAEKDQSSEGDDDDRTSASGRRKQRQENGISGVERDFG